LVHRVKKRISIDELVNLYFDDKLIYEGSENQNPFDGRAERGMVSMENPLVNRIISRLNEIKDNVNHKYDVKVIEDYLDSISEFGRSVSDGLYSLFGVPYLYGKLAARGFVRGTSDRYERWKENRRIKARAAAIKAKERKAQLKLRFQSLQEKRALDLKERETKRIERESQKLDRHEKWAARIDAIKEKFSGFKGKIVYYMRPERPAQYYEPVYAFPTMQEMGDTLANVGFKIRHFGQEDYGVKDVERVVKYKDRDTPYLVLIKTVDDLDEKISGIAGMKHIKPVFTLRKDVSKRVYFNDEAMHINLDNVDILLSEIRTSEAERRGEGIILLEDLIEAKAQQKVYERGVSVKGIQMGIYDDEILMENQKLRGIILNQFVKNKIDLDAQLDAVLRAGKSWMFTSLPNKFYDCLKTPSRLLKSQAALENVNIQDWEAANTTVIKNWDKAKAEGKEKAAPEPLKHWFWDNMN
jgi:hypothetical protein